MSLKEEILQLVSKTDDENLLKLVKANIDYYKDSKVDILDELSIEDRNELINMLNEPDEKDTISEDEFKTATEKWRTR